MSFVTHGTYPNIRISNESDITVSDSRYGYMSEFQSVAISESLDIAREWFDATNGEFITETQYSNLFKSGFASYPLAEIKFLFTDWTSFNQAALDHIQSQREQEKRAMDETITEIMESVSSGLVPDAILKKTVLYYEKNKDANKKSLARYALSDELADPETILTRYYKYQLITLLSQSDEVNNETTDERKTNTAMGFTLSTGRPLSSFKAVLLKRYPQILEEEIIELADRLGIYGHIFPGSKKNHQKALIKAGNNARIPVHYFDVATGEVLKGQKNVVEHKRKHPGATVKRLGSLLLKESLDINFADPNHHKYKDWEDDDYIKYGNWLLNLIKPHNLNKQILINATRLGIGPGPRGITRVFGNSVNFFRELEADGTSQYGLFDDWSFEDCVQHIKKVAAEIGDRPTQQSLQARVKLGFIEPTPSVIRKLTGSFTRVMEAAGFPQYNRKLSNEEIIDASLAFYDEHGRLPQRKDFYESQDLPSFKAVRNHFGGLVRLKEELSSIINEYEAKRKIAA
jgi:hypothetical protein